MQSILRHCARYFGGSLLCSVGSCSTKALQASLGTYVRSNRALHVIKVVVSSVVQMCRGDGGGGKASSWAVAASVVPLAPISKEFRGANTGKSQREKRCYIPQCGSEQCPQRICSPCGHRCCLHMVHSAATAHSTTRTYAKRHTTASQHNTTCLLLGLRSIGIFQPCLSRTPWRDLACPLEVLGAQEAWLGTCRSMVEALKTLYPDHAQRPIGCCRCREQWSSSLFARAHTSKKQGKYVAAFRIVGLKSVNTGSVALVVTVVLCTWCTSQKRPTTPRTPAPKHTQPHHKTTLPVYCWDHASLAFFTHACLQRLGGTLRVLSRCSRPKKHG